MWTWRLKVRKQPWCEAHHLDDTCLQKGTDFSEAEVNRSKTKGQGKDLDLHLSLHECCWGEVIYPPSVLCKEVTLSSKQSCNCLIWLERNANRQPVSFRGYCSWDYLSHHFALGLLKFRLVLGEDKTNYFLSLSIMLMRISRHWKRAWGREIASGQIFHECLNWRYL